MRPGPHVHTPERTREPGRVGRPLGRGALPHRPTRHRRTAPVSRETTLPGAWDYREDVSREAALLARVCRPASFPVNRLPSRRFAGRVDPREPALFARGLTRRVFHVKHRIGHGLRIPAFCPDPRSVLTPQDPHGRRGGTWGQLAATHQHRRASTRHHIAPPHGISHRRMRAHVPIDHGHDAPPTLLHASPALAASSLLLSAETTPQRRAHHRRCRAAGALCRRRRVFHVKRLIRNSLASTFPHTEHVAARRDVRVDVIAHRHGRATRGRRCRSLDEAEVERCLDAVQVGNASVQSPTRATSSPLAPGPEWESTVATGGPMDGSAGRAVPPP